MKFLIQINWFYKLWYFKVILKVLNFRYIDFIRNFFFCYSNELNELHGLSYSSETGLINMNKYIVFTKTFMKYVIKMFYLWNITFISEKCWTRIVFFSKRHIIKNHVKCIMQHSKNILKYHPSLIIKTHFHMKNFRKNVLGTFS